jgi:hypothetical protein
MQNHLFWVTSEAPTIMHSKTYDDDADYNIWRYDHLRNVGANRLQQMMQYELEPLPRPGLKPIKQVELWKKWSQFVPQQYWEDICPRPSPEIIEQVAQERNKSRREKVASRRSTRVDASRV